MVTSPYHTKDRFHMCEIGEKKNPVEFYIGYRLKANAI